MCKPLKEYLGVIRDYTREIVTFGGFVIAVFIYLDFREVVKEQATNAAHTARSYGRWIPVSSIWRITTSNSLNSEINSNCKVFLTSSL